MTHTWGIIEKKNYYNHADPFFEEIHIYEELLNDEYKKNGNTLKFKVLEGYLGRMYKFISWVYG